MTAQLTTGVAPTDGAPGHPAPESSGGGQDDIPSNGIAHPSEDPIRYTLLGGRVGVASRTDRLRAAVEAALWLGLAPLPIRLLWRIGARHAAARGQRWWARGAARALDLRIDMEGVDLIDPGKAYVAAPLHEGFADVLALFRLPLRLRFVVRDELVGWSLLGAYLRDTDQVVIRPEDGARAFRRMTRAARPLLARGESLVVFPQGSILGVEIDFTRGAFALAGALDRPLLPIALSGSHRVWEHPFTPRLRRGERISLRVLPPIPAANIRARGAERVRQEVQRRLKAEALGGTMAPPRRFVPARDGFWDGYAYEIDPAFPALAAAVAAHRAGLSPGSTTRDDSSTPI